MDHSWHLGVIRIFHRSGFLFGFILFILLLITDQLTAELKGLLLLGVRRSIKRLMFKNRPVCWALCLHRGQRQNWSVLTGIKGYCKFKLNILATHHADDIQGCWKSISLAYLHSYPVNLLQMAVCLTRALGEWIATAHQMDPGSVVPVQQVSVAMEHTVKTSMRCEIGLLSAIMRHLWILRHLLHLCRCLHCFFLPFPQTPVWHGIWCLLQSERCAALCQHQSRFPLLALPETLQGHPALWDGRWSSEDKQTGELKRL